MKLPLRTQYKPTLKSFIRIAINLNPQLSPQCNDALIKKLIFKQRKHRR